MINDFITEVSYLFVEISPYLILGFIISGFLYLLTSKEMIANNVNYDILGPWLSSVYNPFPFSISFKPVVHFPVL